MLEKMLTVNNVIQGICSIVLVTMPYWFLKIKNLDNRIMSRELRWKQKQLHKNYLKYVFMLTTIFALFESDKVKVLKEYFSSNIIFFDFANRLLPSEIFSNINTLLLKFWDFMVDKGMHFNVVVFAMFTLHLCWHTYQAKKIINDKEGLIDKYFTSNIKKIIKKMFANPEGRDIEYNENDSEEISFLKRLQIVSPYKEYEKVYILKNNFVQVRSLYKFLFIIDLFMLLLVKLLLENDVMLFENPVRILIFMILLTLYSMELYSYHNGYTKEEYELYKKKMNNREQKKENQEGEIRDFYSKDFIKYSYPENPEMPHNKPSKKLWTVVDLGDKIDELSRSDDYRIRCLGRAWADILINAPIFPEFMDAAEKLVKHQSVWFATPFYQDIGSYIFPFLSFELLEKKKILILSGTRDAEEQLKKWMISGLQGKYGHLEFWNVLNMRDSTDDVDISIVPLSQMNEIVIKNESRGFWDHISVVILLEPSYFIPFHPVMMSQILNKMKKSQEKLTYIVCDTNMEGMIDLLSDTLKESFIYVNATIAGANEKNHLIIDSDYSTVESKFKSSSKVFSNELQVVSFLLRNMNCKKINWYGNRRMPIWDVSCEVGQYYKLFDIDNDNIISQGVLNELIDFQEDGNESYCVEKSFNLVEDYLYNAKEILKQYDTRGYVSSYTVVFSPNYLLRDYMISKKSSENYAINHISQHLPRFQYSFHNMVIALTYRLCNGSMNWREIEKMYRYYGFVPEDELESFITKINKRYQDEFPFSHVKLVEDYLSGDEGINTKHYDKKIMISNEEGIEEFRNWYKENVDIVKYYNENIESNRCYLNAVAGGHVYQYYLPGQYLTLEGKYYSIQKIENQEEGIALRIQRAASSYKHRRYYRQIRTYSVENICGKMSRYLHRENISINFIKADITVSTSAYLCSKKFNEIWNADRVDTEGLKRKYYKKKFLKVQINEGNIFTYAILLKEMLVTIFPLCWQLIAIVMLDITEELEGRIDRLKLVGSSSDNIESGNTFYIIEDSPMDLGILETIYDQFDYLFELMSQYAVWGSGEGKGSAKNFFGKLFDNQRVINLESITRAWEKLTEASVSTREDDSIE